MRHYCIVGNHKMNVSEYEHSLEPERKKRFVNTMTKAVREGHTIVLCPTSVRIEHIADVVNGTGVALGAQNCHWENSGAYTGEVSPSMLAEMGCTWVIVGHSERRRDQCETDELIGRKASAALTNGLRPIICIGESIEQRRRGKTIDVLNKQIDGILSACGRLVFDASVIAYEPVWAIGTGLSATTEQIEEAHLAIRESCRERGILDTPILYGGSVSADNSDEILSCQHVSGALVGGASLSSDNFSSIVESAIRCANA